MTPAEAISVLRNQRQQYVDKLIAHNRRTDSAHYLKLDQRLHVQRQISALDMAVVALTLIDSQQINKEITDAHNP